jgi:hypothetical protein
MQAEFERGDSATARIHFARTSRVPLIAPYANNERIFASQLLLLGMITGRWRENRETHNKYAGNILSKDDPSLAMFPSDSDLQSSILFHLHHSLHNYLIVE